MQKWRKFHLQELKIAVNNSCCTPRANAMRNDPVHLTVISAAAAALLLFPRFCNQTLFDMCFLLVEYVLYTLYTLFSCGVVFVKTMSNATKQIWIMVMVHEYFQVYILLGHFYSNITRSF